jgi:hypothetical protein
VFSSIFSRADTTTFGFSLGRKCPAFGITSLPARDVNNSRSIDSAGGLSDAISSETMDVLARYPWPGNIRELQNVVERSVVVYKKGDFSVNESWLRRESLQFEPAAPAVSRRSSMEEREIIWAALTETRGRVSGPFGAAAKLGIPPSTLESKIRSMNIDKYRFKASRSSAQRSRIQDRFSRTSRIREETATL